MDPGSTPVHRSEMHTGVRGVVRGVWDLLLQNSCHTHSYSVVGFDYQVCCGFVV